MEPSKLTREIEETIIEFLSRTKNEEELRSKIAEIIKIYSELNIKLPANFTTLIAKANVRRIKRKSIRV